MMPNDGTVYINANWLAIKNHGIPEVGCRAIFTQNPHKSIILCNQQNRKSMGC
ncbi:hypothetical protein [Legionella pneumophila]|uniref:Uncharacterized protein n=1 Tax=Legionella pneumophila subsp. pascullei TaxID=91890 RepID=A0AAX2IT54_LEGPN|nr:hypothetical protein [Legionella pneumophila]SQG89083.1 Uncharacterised protein [Legionella pneumophila subsp. pascullei]VEH04133.1 Uncharacterised protein [Legionella pneumophila subsp. pascullei]HAT6916700.1 hypothetical protein [Legionella pneumophila]HAT6920671.1 hypothetical protein [Legionella pneumophila]HAT6971783.1 hypothetical protein [Legionella pneumophila]